MSGKELSVDIDGTLAQSIIPLMHRLRKEHGVRMRLTEIKRYDMQKATGVPKPIIRKIWREVWEVPEDIPLVSKRIPSTLERLRQSGFSIKILTGSIAEERYIKRWLKLNGIGYQAFVKVGDWKLKPLRAGDIHVDDHWSVSEAFAREGRRMILLSQPWNRGRNGVWRRNEHIKVARDWAHVERILSSGDKALSS